MSTDFIIGLDSLLALSRRRDEKIPAQRKREMRKSKARLIHINVILAAFEKYLHSQLIPKDLISSEIREFTRLLAKEVANENN